MDTLGQPARIIETDLLFGGCPKCSPPHDLPKDQRCPKCGSQGLVSHYIVSTPAWSVGSPKDLKDRVLGHARSYTLVCVVLAFLVFHPEGGYTLPILIAGSIIGAWIVAFMAGNELAAVREAMLVNTQAWASLLEDRQQAERLKDAVRLLHERRIT